MQKVKHTKCNLILNLLSEIEHLGFYLWDYVTRQIAIVLVRYKLLADF